MNMDFTALAHFNPQHLDTTPASDPSTVSATQATSFLDLPPSTGASPLSSSSTHSSTSNSKSASKTPHSRPPKEDDEAAVKRYRNTLAARKYRQKRIDRIKDLEEALEEVTRERDELRIQLARQEAQNEALRSMMKLKESGS